jgi:hypothetical protein
MNNRHLRLLSALCLAAFTFTGCAIAPASCAGDQSWTKTPEMQHIPIGECSPT